MAHHQTVLFPDSKACWEGTWNPDITREDSRMRKCLTFKFNGRFIDLVALFGYSPTAAVSLRVIPFMAPAGFDRDQHHHRFRDRAIVIPMDII